MIVSNKNWLQLIFSVHGTTIQKIWLRVIAVMVFALIPTYIFVHHETDAYSLSAFPFTVVGLALAIFLGFRNSAAFARFWEGRKLWGGMVNSCRSFAIQVSTLIQDDEANQDVTDLREELLHSTLAYVNAFRHRLRQSDPGEDLQRYLPDAEVRAEVQTHDNIPVAIAQRMGETIAQAWKRGWLDTFHLPVLQATLKDMLAVQGGCERIKTTPIPYTYSVLTHRTVMLYCLALPCGLHDTVGILTPIVVGFVAYAFLGLDAVGSEIEQPFGTEENHLPLSAITRTIERDVLQLLHEEPTRIPPPLEPVNEVLN